MVEDMNDLSLAKSVLPPGWIDACVGEVSSVAEVLLRKFCFEVDLTKPEDFAYPPPNGNPALVKLLEDRYQAPVILTNGAKQGLAAIFYALARKGHKSLGMETPFWSLIPPLAKIYGLDRLGVEGGDCWLLVFPNNPDGRVFYSQGLERFALVAKRTVPIIHDAAYYTHTYLPESYQLNPIGDVQIFSASKMLGLSGLRAGYCVFYNTDLYQDVLGYVEATTVGVSNLSQKILLQIFDPSLKDMYADFEQESFEGLVAAKRIAQTLNPEVLEVPDHLESIPGVFGWFKKGPKYNPEQAKVLLADGAPFGDPKMARMNLGLPLEKLKLAVKRLNHEA